MKMKKKDVVIVGAGMAGLTSAAYLTRENYHVVLLDKNDEIGGVLHTVDKDGFVFDTGPRAFVNSGIVRPILKDLGIRWDFVDNSISLGFEDQLFRVDSMEAIEEYQRILTHLYPESVGDIEKIIPIISNLSAHTSVLYEFDNPNFGNFAGDWKFMVRKLLPWTVKFLIALRKFNQFSMPMEVFLERLTDNQSLIDILTQHFFRKTPTYFALGYFYVYLDYFYPKGGTGMLAQLLKEKVRDGGGEIQLNTRIVEVSPAERTVTDAEGHSYHYDHLIWAADLKTLYRSLNLAGLDADVTQSITSQARSMLAAKGAESVFILYLGVDRPPSYFKARGGEHMFYTPSRKGLGDTNRERRQDLVARFAERSQEDVVAWLESFCSLNTYEVSIPVLRDPALAPEGQTGVMISCLFDYDLMEKVAEAGWYEEFKTMVEDRIVSVLSQTLYEGLEDDVLFKFSSTPLTINKVSGSSEGAITGWSFETNVPVISKLRDIPKSVLTPIPGVLQAGQWAYSPAGVPIAMLTGWYATQNIIKSA